MRRLELLLLAIVLGGCVALGAGARHLTHDPSAPPPSPAVTRAVPLALSKVSLSTRLSPLAIPPYPHKRSVTEASAGETGSGSGVQATGTPTTGTPTTNGSQLSATTTTKTSSKKTSTTPKTTPHQPSTDPLDDGGGTLGG